jgi:hypothetical protein
LPIVWGIPGQNMQSKQCGLKSLVQEVQTIATGFFGFDSLKVRAMPANICKNAGHLNDFRRIFNEF